MTTSFVKIYLVDYHGYYYPGQTITGYAECNFNSEKKVEAIRLTFKGRAHTRWTESRGSGKSRRTVVYESREFYFDATYDLLAGQPRNASEDAYYLPSGKHTYPFSYILPPLLPASCEQHYGNIRYYVKAVVDRPWKFDYEDKLAFNVFSPFDLNTMPQLRAPANIASETVPCSCCCNQSGPITFTISLPVTGFIPTQTVAVGAHISNMSNINVEKVVLKLVKNRQFLAASGLTAHQRHSEDILVECHEGGVGAHGQKSWTTALEIPNITFENMIPCTIINDSYTVKAKAILPGIHSNLKNSVEVTIGTTPLAGISTEFTAAPPTSTPPILSTAAGDFETFEVLSPTEPGASAPLLYPQEEASPSAPKDFQQNCNR